MKENTIIIEMTPFLFEDGKTYYFDIKKLYTNAKTALARDVKLTDLGIK